MPNVCVELSGRYDMGYTVMVNPWLAVVSKKKKGTITWKGSHPLKIKHATPNNFKTPAGAGTWKKSHKSGAVTGAPGKKIYHYSISIKAAPGHIVTIDPDYRIDP